MILFAFKMNYVNEFYHNVMLCFFDVKRLNERKENDHEINTII